MPTSLEAILIVAYGIVPGYLFLLARDAVSTHENKDATKQVIHSIAVSLFFWIIVGPILFKTNLLKDYPVASLIGASICAILGPSIAGVFFAKIESSEKIRSKLHLKHHIPKAWDFRFSKGENLWVLVTLNDGSRVGGLWINDSFASSYPNEEDLYLETVYCVDDNGKFYDPKKGTAGIWLPKSSIRCLEFWKLEIKNDEKNIA